MDAFFWWSGIVAWGAFATVGVIAVIDWIIEWLAGTFHFKKEFLAFAWDRMKRRDPPSVPGG